MNDFYGTLETIPQTIRFSTTPLSHLGLLSIEGPDAKKFLQGQLTLDLESLKTCGQALGAHCNIKGHIVSLFRVYRITDELYYASIQLDLIASALETLKKYSIFSKVTLSHETEWIGLAASEQHRSTLARSVSIELSDAPISHNANASDEDKPSMFAAQLSPSITEFWVCGDNKLEAIKGDLTEKSDLNALCLEQIRLGWPEIQTQTREHFIPQMVNLQALGGVSFSKGCYTGQEIVTRLQHRGILKKAMYRFSLKSDQIPQPGDSLFDDDAKAVGEVVRAAQAAEGSFELLAVVQQNAMDQDRTLHNQSGSALSRLDLPYTIDPKLFQSKR